jgi:ribosomal protein L22
MSDEPEQTEAEAVDSAASAPETTSADTAESAPSAETAASVETEAEKPTPKRTRAAKPKAEVAEVDAEAKAEEPEAAEKPKRARAAKPKAEEAAVEAPKAEKPAKAEPKSKQPEPKKPETKSRRSRTERHDPVAAPVVRAQAKYVRSSARKARLVCDNIRGKSVEDARAILAHTPRAVAQDWIKLLESAVANAEHNHELVGEDLVIKAVHADEGPTIKRFRPRAMGRATKIRKRTSHLTILLTPKN